MRTLRLSLAGTVMLALIAGLAAVAAAQEESAPVTFVTGTVAEVYGPDHGEGESDLASYGLRGYEVMTQSALIREVVEWSDPRLPTDLWLAVGYTLISTGEDEFDGAMNMAWQGLLEDEEGRWHGTGRSLQGTDEKYSLYVLTGEGAYEGLSALLRGTTPDDTEAALLHAHAPWDMAYEGYIFEAEMTPFPDEPVPFTTGSYQLWPVPNE
ncbi:MAG: hypothetical protein PVG27_12500 [Chloroflexota bacterium]